MKTSRIQVQKLEFNMSRYTILHSVVPLLLLLLALVLCRNGVRSQVNPGLQFCLSQRGFDYAGKVAVEKLYDLAQQIQIPDHSDSKSVTVGNVEYAVTNMRVGMPLLIHTCK